MQVKWITFYWFTVNKTKNFNASNIKMALPIQTKRDSEKKWELTLVLVFRLS